MSDEGERVEVDPAPAQAPVQAGRGAAAGMTRVERAECRAGSDHGPGPDGRLHRLVRGEQAVRVRDAHDADPGDDPGVVHGARAGGQDGLVGGAGEVDAPVAGEPGGGRGLESAEDRGAGGERPAVSGGGGRGVELCAAGSRGWAVPRKWGRVFGLGEARYRRAQPAVPRKWGSVFELGGARCRRAQPVVSRKWGSVFGLGEAWRRRARQAVPGEWGWVFGLWTGGCGSGVRGGDVRR